ncbi:hypothetical protein FACS1894179_00870 [Bacteroidia bacterium]|nr:hypothetical protein FACS1894169_07960 [Bacteroidia bacterium]GHV38096.1 hypothetical protein FACS1894179_00870 [Bacteroidia bacterium]
METLLLIVTVFTLIGGIIVLKLVKGYRRIFSNTKRVEYEKMDIPSGRRNISIPRKEEQEVSRKRKNKKDYESLFIQETPITGRKEKTTYLRSQFYKKIQGIILCYDNPNLSVFGYIDTVLAHHFEMYESDIKDILKRKVDE